jgi:hypothetical protein
MFPIIFIRAEGFNTPLFKARLLMYAEGTQGVLSVGVHENTEGDSVDKMITCNFLNTRVQAGNKRYYTQSIEGPCTERYAR